MYGAPALKIKGKLLACIPTHKSAEPDSLAVRIDFDQRDALPKLSALDSGPLPGRAGTDHDHIESGHV